MSKVRFHPEAVVELENLYDFIADRTGPAVALKFVTGISDFCAGLSTFPLRGTVRAAKLPGLRIIGYRRSVSIAFTQQDGDVLILGVFYAGRNVTAELLEDRR